MGLMKEHSQPFRYWRMKVPLWKRIYWRIPWVSRRRNKALAEKITNHYAKPTGCDDA